MAQVFINLLSAGGRASRPCHFRIVSALPKCDEHWLIRPVSGLAVALCLSLVLSGLSQLLMADDAQPRPARVLLIGQKPDGHPAATHEYLPGQHVVASLLARFDGIQTVIVSADGEWVDGPELLDGADAAVVFVSEGARWLSEDPQRLAAFRELAQRRGGMVCLHWGMGTKDAANIDAFVGLFGACHGGPDRRYKVIDAKLQPTADGHPVLSGIAPFDVHEEFYFKLKQPPSDRPVTSLFKVDIEDELQTVDWAWDRADGGRSAGFSGLHFHDNWKHEAYRRFVAQAVLWTLRRDIPEDGVDVTLPESVLRLPVPVAAD